MQTQAEYEAREHAIFQAQLNHPASLDRFERSEQYNAFADALENDQAIIAERISWLLNGSYGFGSYKVARNVAARTGMNRAAWMVQTIGALEWMVDQRQVVKAWKALSKEHKDSLNAAVMAEVQYHLAERAKDEGGAA